MEDSFISIIALIIVGLMILLAIGTLLYAYLKWSISTIIALYEDIEEMYKTKSVLHIRENLQLIEILFMFFISYFLIALGLQNQLMIAKFLAISMLCYVFSRWFKDKFHTLSNWVLWLGIAQYVILFIWLLLSRIGWMITLYTLGFGLFVVAMMFGYLMRELVALHFFIQAKEEKTQPQFYLGKIQKNISTWHLRNKLWFAILALTPFIYSEMGWLHLISRQSVSFFEAMERVVYYWI